MIAVDRGRLAVWTIMGAMVRGGVRAAVRLMGSLSAVAVAAGLLVPRVDVSAIGADAAGQEGAVVVLVADVATPSQNQRTRGPGTAAAVVIAVCPLREAVLVESRIVDHRRMRTIAEPVAIARGTPVPVRRTRGPGTTALNASEAVALVDAAERPGEVEQLIID